MRLWFACELDVCQRRERIHHGDQIVGTQLLDERSQSPPERNHDLWRLVDVVVVEKQHEQTHIFACGFDGCMLGGTDAGRFAKVSGRLTGQLHELHRFHRLRDSVLLHDEVGSLQTLNRLVPAAKHGDVHSDEVDASSENGLLRLWFGRRLRLRLRLLCQRRRHGKQANHGRHGKGRPLQGASAAQGHEIFHLFGRLALAVWIVLPALMLSGCHGLRGRRGQPASRGRCCR